MTDQTDAALVKWWTDGSWSLSDPPSQLDIWRAAAAWRAQRDAEIATTWDNGFVPQPHHCRHNEECPSCYICQKCIAAALKKDAGL